MEWTEVTEEEFQTYERVRRSGVTNMCHVRNVAELTDLDREVVTCIMEHYGDLAKKYPEVVS